MVHDRKKIRVESQLPMKLDVSHGHLAAAQESQPSRSQPKRYRQTADELDDSPDPHLGYRMLRGAKNPEELLRAVKGEHGSCDDSEESISLPGKGFQFFHRQRLYNVFHKAV